MDTALRRSVSAFLTATILASSAVLPASAQERTDKLMQRAAQGELSQPGGARRLTGDIT